MRCVDRVFEIQPPVGVCESEEGAGAKLSAETQQGLAEVDASVTDTTPIVAGCTRSLFVEFVRRITEES
jgi:hypothetical protein